MKNKKMIFVTICIVVLLILILIIFWQSITRKSEKVTNNVNTNVQADKQENTNVQADKQENTNAQIDKQEGKKETTKQKEELGNIDLKKIEKFLNKKENNAFILPSYDNVGTIDLYYIISTEKFSLEDENEIKEYEKLTNTEVTTGIYKATAEQIKNTLKSKFNVEHVNSINDSNIQYVKEKDSYYALNSDDLYVELICTSGVKNGDIYVVEYQAKEKVGNQVKGTVTLTKQDNSDNWFFVSNKVIETNIY